MRSTYDGFALAGASVVVVLSVLALLLGGDNGEKKSTVAQPSSSAVPTPTPFASLAPSAAATAPPTRGAAATVRPAPTTSVVAGPVRPKPAHAPEAGTYTFKRTDASGTADEHLVVEDAGGGRQTERHPDITDEVQWSSSGKFARATTFGTPPNGVRCDWNPDWAEYAFPLTAGKSWTVKSSCHPAATASVEIVASLRVTRAERTSVGGTTVDVWVILTDATITFRTPQGTDVEKVQDEDHFAPDHGITVHEKTTSSGTDPATGKSTNDTETRELVSLYPSTTSA